MAKRRADRFFKKSWRRIVPLLLIIVGIGIAVIALIIVWQQNPAASPRTIILNLLDPPYIIGAAVGLMVIGLVAAFFMSSKETKKRSLRAFLMLLAAFLVFGGPTYLMYILKEVITSYSLVVFLGLASFIVGLVLFMRLIKEK
ncbi:hypothetical protein DRO69_11135 [Candidatus Bathyarchaeota archaeon]|nr:MAG: hypothetical protein DRO69_11135 [Candidatus Bathyarchaeota archaeon]